jgi:hypothetical protein
MPRKNRKPLPDTGRPWNEEEWEAFMKESDLAVRALWRDPRDGHGSPRRDALIDRHMGWDQPDDARRRR